MTPHVPQFLSFAVIAPLLGLTDDSAYPTEASCPFCESLSLVVQLSNDGRYEWYYCRQCNRTGTVLAMAADRWQVTEQEAAEYLRRHTDPPGDKISIEKYFTQQQQREKVLTLWHASCKQLLRLTPVQVAALRRLQCVFPQNTEPDFLQTRISPLLGVISPVMTKTKDRDNWLELQLQPEQGKPGTRVGIILPFYCIPKTSTPAQLQVIIRGIQTELPRTQQLSKIRHPCIAPPLLRPCGLLGLPLLQLNRESFVVLTSMHRAMIELHLRHYRTNPTPLSLLGWQPKPSEILPHMWPFLRGREIILWEKTASSAALQLAANFEARVFFGEAPELPGATAADLLDAVRSRAVPWRTALNSQLLKMRPEDKTLLLSAAAASSCTLLLDELRQRLPDNIRYPACRSFLVQTLTRRSSFRSLGHELWTYQNEDLRDSSGEVRLIGKFVLSALAVKYPCQHEKNYARQLSLYLGYYVVEGFRVPFWYPCELNVHDKRLNARKSAWAELMMACVNLLPAELSATVVHMLRLLRTSPVALAMATGETCPAAAIIEPNGWTGSRFNFCGGEFSRFGYRSQHPLLVPDKTKGPDFRGYLPQASPHTLLQENSDIAVFAWVTGSALAEFMLQQIRSQPQNTPKFKCTVEQLAVLRWLQREWTGMIRLNRSTSQPDRYWPTFDITSLDVRHPMAASLVREATARMFDWKLKMMVPAKQLRVLSSVMANRVNSLQPIQPH